MHAERRADLAAEDGALDDRVARVIAELDGVDGVDIKAVELQGKDGGLVAHIAVDYMALDAEDAARLHWSTLMHGSFHHISIQCSNVLNSK